MTQKSLPNSKGFWILIGIGLFVVFALRQVPATWGGYLLTRGNGLALGGITGSLWHGRAALASIQLDGRDHPLGTLEWDLQWLSLLRFTPCVQLDTELQTQTFTGQLCVSATGLLSLNQASLSLPASLVQERLPVPVGGEFFAQIEQAQLRGNVLLSLKGDLKWVDAQVNNGANWMDLGSFAAELGDNGNNGVSAHVHQLSGPVDVSLQVELTAPSGGSVKGELAMTKAFVENSKASGLLSMIAREQNTDSSGKTHYQVDMSL